VATAVGSARDHGELLPIPVETVWREYHRQPDCQAARQVCVDLLVRVKPTQCKIAWGYRPAKNGVHGSCIRPAGGAAAERESLHFPFVFLGHGEGSGWGAASRFAFAAGFECEYRAMQTHGRPGPEI